MLADISVRTPYKKFSFVRQKMDFLDEHVQNRVYLLMKTNSLYRVLCQHAKAITVAGCGFLKLNQLFFGYFDPKNGH